MEDLQEEADRLFEDIRRGCSPAILDHYRTCDASETKRFLDLMDKRQDDGSNTLIFAIDKGQYGCARTILEIFKSNVEEEQSTNILLARDKEGNDCLRILMKHRMNAEHQHEKDIDELFEMILQFPDSFKKLAKAEIGRNGATIFAVKNKLGDYAEKLLPVLPVDMQLNLIKPTEDCAVSGGSEKRDLYNLLMLWLPVHEPLVDTIIGIVCAHGGQAYKSEVVMGTVTPEVFSQSENCLRLAVRLAVRNHNSKHLVHLFKECVPEDLQFKALLEVGPCGNSAMSVLLEADDIETLKELLGNCESVESMRETLYDPATRSNFMQLKMKPQAIDYFQEIKLFRYNFFIPKPSKLSKPFAWIFKGRRFGVDKHAKELSEVLLSIGGRKDRVKMVYNMRELRTIQKISSNCSFLLLHITHVGMYSHFNEHWIIDVICNSLPEFIPKVIICDDYLPPYWREEEFADQRIDFRSKLAKHNILLLRANSWGEVPPKHSLSSALAEQIKAANGKTSLQEMFTAAVEKVKSRCKESESTENITFHMVSPSKRIVLRRYDGKENTCRICKEDIRSCSQQCMICSTCHKWYHLTCLDIDEGHLKLSRNKWFNWLCETCYANEVNIVGNVDSTNSAVGTSPAHC